ncbi:TetR/AcrR family transcriptional regulator [Pseudalkalibacillus caeni]|uniref:TetR/AcrR family transcriptional regulator n=1 Tax=Exobacillus caeni TaxID=2574798 RepID=A0A5R9F701_9BACL|nr:TetR/AcrR family transcriptional regulator [Pseudalkalibacillus caeni]TLS38289.1 TetR/AcrR family transcriptional regulator [Pseudalkalibacillus caeni]
MKGKIIEKSLQLFETKGFSETSIQDIVDEMGVTKGTFYYYFKSKKQLLMDIHTMYISELLKMQTEIMNNSEKDAKEKIKGIVSILVKSIRTHGPSARVFFRELRHLDEKSLPEIIEKRDKVRYNLQKVIEDGIDSGELRSDLKPDIITFGILGMCNWSYSWFNPEGPASEEDVILTYVEMTLKGLLPY